MPADSPAASVRGVGIGYTLATGRLFCSFPEFQEWCESFLMRPVMTHEFGDARVWDELRAKFEAHVEELSRHD